MFDAAGTPGFVAGDERERILVAFADAVVERGYAHVTLDDVLRKGHVDPVGFARHFADLERWFLAAYDAAYEQAFTAAGAAFVATPGDWALGARAALEALWEFVTHSPTFAWLCTVEVFHVGERALAHRTRSLEMFAEFLEPGYAAAGERAPQRLVSEMIAGGIFELARRYTTESRLHQLPETLPSVVLFVLTPFVGREEAYRLAGLASSGA
jgi:AcrR family transcriptional regulator